jgi:hypothetical protein
MGALEVDLTGLRKLIAKRGKGWIIGELLQNAWDALQACPNDEGTGRVEVTLERVERRPNTAWLVVKDDSAAGFTDLTHAFTLFAESNKKGDPTLRGRFNIGEKLVIAIAEAASIVSTSGSVHFKNNRRRKGDEAIKAGTIVKALIPMTSEEMFEALAFARRCISPPSVRTTINGQVLSVRRPLRTGSCTLQTVVADDEGYLIRRDRKTDVRILAKVGDQAWLYEMGLPLVELSDDAFDVDVCQKVPVDWERRNVPAAWLRNLRAEVLNWTYDMLDAETASSRAVTEAIAKAEDEAVRHVIAMRFPNAATYDVNDREANSQAVSQGMQIVPGRTFDKETWEAIRRTEALKPASHYHPTPKPFGEEGKPAGLVAPTPAMGRFKAFCRWLSREILGHDIRVLFYERMNDNGVAACYSKEARELGFNMRRLGKAWFADQLSERHLDIVVHEFGHDYASDHLSMKYHNGLTEIAARIALLAIARPNSFDLTSYRAEEEAG